MAERQSSLYIDLMKKVLLDYDRINDYEYHPLPIVNPNWKTAFLFPLDKLLRTRNFALCKLKFVDEEKRMNGMDWPANAKTMVGMKRLDNIEHCIHSILQENIGGDLMETGVWRGGSAMLMKAVLKEHGIEDRKVWLADSFRGLPRPNAAKYSADKGNKLHRQSILNVSRKEVEENFRKLELLDEKVEFLEGWFSETLPSAAVEKLALLRLDGDLYESTILALEHLYPKLSVGGFVIIDDFNAFSFCKQAVLDYRKKHGISEPMIEIDQEAVFWKKIKTKD